MELGESQTHPEGRVRIGSRDYSSGLSVLSTCEVSHIPTDSRVHRELLKHSHNERKHEQVLGLTFERWDKPRSSIGAIDDPPRATETGNNDSLHLKFVMELYEELSRPTIRSRLSNHLSIRRASAIVSIFRGRDKRFVTSQWAEVIVIVDSGARVQHKIMSTRLIDFIRHTISSCNCEDGLAFHGSFSAQTWRTWAVVSVRKRLEPSSENGSDPSARALHTIFARPEPRKARASSSKSRDKSSPPLIRIDFTSDSVSHGRYSLGVETDFTLGDVEDGSRETLPGSKSGARPRND